MGALELHGRCEIGVAVVAANAVLVHAALLLLVFLGLGLAIVAAGSRLEMWSRGLMATKDVQETSAD